MLLAEGYIIEKKQKTEMESLVHKFEAKLRERCLRMTFEGRKIQMEKIDALLAIAAAILVFLGVSGSFRRRCSNPAFATVAFAAYTLTPVVIAYTLGLIQTAQFCSPRLPIWATYLVVFLGNVDSYTAHSMADIERWKSFKVDSAAKCIMTSWMIVSYVLLYGVFLYGPIMCILFIILFMKFDGRAEALKLASNSMMQKNDRYIADYMSTERQFNDSCDGSMIGYRYLVSGAEEARVHSLCSRVRRRAALWLDGDRPPYRQQLEVTDEVITIEKVWQCDGRLLRRDGGDPDGQLKDLCLSFSLFKLIRLRFTGYSLPQEAHEKLLLLIWHMLYEENGYERVFRVIEVELAFLFDLFYTKYPVNLHRRHFVYTLLLLPIVVIIPVLLIYAAISYKLMLVTVVTALLMMSILVVELTQFGIMIFSEWAKVTYICNYVRNNCWQRNRYAEKLIEILCRVWLVKPWGRELRQYSFLKSYSYSPPKWIYNRLTAAYLDQKRNGQKQIAPINLSNTVKMAIDQSLKRYIERRPASLRLYNLFDEFPAFRQDDLFDEFQSPRNLGTTTHVIMVWHIATTLCEHGVPYAQLSQQQRDNFDIATKLSQYLAYLVVFAPRLLPGHPCRTEYIFGHAVKEAKRILRGSSVSMQDRIERLRLRFNNGQHQETIVAQGAQLGMQLMNAGTWEILANFWADMMLYVAPSNDTAAHAECLTTGGEFLTHIWVLVSHAGIVRDPHDGD